MYIEESEIVLWGPLKNDYFYKRVVFKWTYLKLACFKLILTKNYWK